MKNLKKFLALIAVFAMVLTCIALLVGCENPGEEHKCSDVCDVCGGCKTECTETECATKCLGHNSTEEHKCGDVCEECNGCKTDCEEPECATKCPGHEVEKHECGDVCEECDGCLTDCEEPECATKCPGHEEDHVCESECDVCGKCENDECDKDECTDKCNGHYTITLEALEGSLPAGAKTTYITTDGLIVLDVDEYLPVATISTAHWYFMGWYDAETAGNEVIEDETIFTEDTTIYARYGRDDGLWKNDGADWVIGLTRNNGASLTGGLQAEYWLGGGKVALNKDDVVSVSMGGDIIPFYIFGSSTGIDKTPGTSVTVKSVTVTVAGDFAIYLKDYSSSSQPVNWVCEFAGPTEVETGSDIPEGCDAIHITWGTNEITFYLVDENGEAVGEDRFGEFYLYTFNGELFGTWQNGVINGTGKLQAEMTSSVTGMPGGWIFRWGSGISQSTGNGGSQTANITGLKSGSTYVITLNGHQQDATVTEITPAE